MKILVTGGLGFIGSELVRTLIRDSDHEVINVDKISYSSTHASVAEVSGDSRYRFRRCDLADPVATRSVVAEAAPDAIVHLAAESHVDRSIDGPAPFLQSNVVGTYNLLESARRLDGLQLFVHVSTDEVYGSLGPDDPRFSPESPYRPRSPYSATKAAADHLVRSWFETYDLPSVVTNCSNNYGPFQFPEKLIPTMIIKSLGLESLPVYGDGSNIRDWLHVSDHVAALLAVLERGAAGTSYLIGGNNERTNLDVVERIAALVSARVGDGIDRAELISFVVDRPGHDQRYGVDDSATRSALGWEPMIDFDEGLEQTVAWYLANQRWWEPLVGSGGVERLGLTGAR